MLTQESSLMELMTTITRVSRSYKSLCDKLAARYGLTQAIAWPVLAISRKGDGVRPSTVAEEVGLGPSSVVRLIDNLVASGYVERRNDVTDRRAKRLFLTERGHQIVPPLEAELANLRKMFLKDLTEGQVSICMQVFTMLDNSIRNHRRHVSQVD